MAEKKKQLLWQVGCEGHVDVWVCADNWELATVEAAKLWNVPWGKVAANCVLLQKKTGIQNTCARCGRVYHGELPLCGACEFVQKTEEERNRERLRAYYKRHGDDGRERRTV